MYRQWAEVYGPVFQVQLGNTTVVVINSAAAAKTLLIGQSAAFNSRPEFYVLHKVVSSQAFSIGTSPWDESCKKRRRAAAGALNRVKTEGYAPVRYFRDHFLYMQYKNWEELIDFIDLETRSNKVH